MELKYKIVIGFILILLVDILLTFAIVGLLYQILGGELSFSAFLTGNFWPFFGIMSAILAFAVGIAIAEHTSTKKKPKKLKKPKQDITFYNKYRVPIIIITIISIIVIATLIQFFF